MARFSRAAGARPSRAGGAVGVDDYLGFHLILISVGLAILSRAGWKMWHAEISAFALFVAHWEMQVIAWFTDRFSLADLAVQRADPAGVEFKELVRLYRNIGIEFLYPAMGLVLGLAALCFFRAGNARFTRAFDLDKLLAEQARSSRAMAAFVGRGLKLAGVREGEPRPTDPALHVSEWIERYAIRGSELDEAGARRELVRQLGAPWAGWERAVPAARCMLAVFALHGGGRREEAARLLGLLSGGLPIDKRDGGAGPTGPLAFDSESLALADRVLADVDAAAWALEIMKAHHFTTPGLMSVLTAARLRSGVLAPAQFAFLKLVDRRLWYALHGLGFESDQARHWSPERPVGGSIAVVHPHPSQVVEAIGPHAHWAAERAVGAPLPAPELDAAITAIRPKCFG